MQRGITRKARKRVVVIENYDSNLLHIRGDLLKHLISNGYKVYALSPMGDCVEGLVQMGCRFCEIEIDRRGTNPLRDMRLFLSILYLLRRIRPDIVLTYTVKPNVYGGLACQVLRIPYISNVTGLGSSVENGGLLSRVVDRLLRVSLGRAGCVFCQNRENAEYVRGHVRRARIRLLPGSGVNLEEFRPLEYPGGGGAVRFAYIGRVMREKGICELLEAARRLRGGGLDVEVHIAGFSERDCEEVVEGTAREGLVTYHGMLGDVRGLLRDVHCVVLPSYHEGMSNALLEAAACARPLIATDIPGCREIVRDGRTGFLVPPRSPDALCRAMARFAGMRAEEMERMGLAARKHVERHFDRGIVVGAYMEEIARLAP